jgi:hypothetical protein
MRKFAMIALAVVLAVPLSSCDVVDEVVSSVESELGVDFGDFGGGGGGSGVGLSAAVPVDSDQRANPGQPRDNTPYVLIPEQPNAAVAGDWGSAVVDYSNTSQGYICGWSALGGTKVKFLVNAPDGSQYQYTTAQSDYYITIPLSCGDGWYSVGVFQNISGDSYSALFQVDIEVYLSDPNLPFLYPNQYVNFYPGDATVQLSQQLTENATSDVEAVEQIYMYVVQNITYDKAKAESVAPGYLPTNDNTLASKSGICFDYASLMASMVRAQRLPCKLEIGWCGQAYHAWLEVYTTDSGVIRKKIDFPGYEWRLMDPTFDSTNKGRGDLSKIVGDGTNYQPLFYY